jgi:hypothetical protein
VRCAGLQSLHILHHGLNAERCHGAGKPLFRGFFALNNRHCHIVFGKVSVDAKHLHGFIDSFFPRRMSRMAFLPEKLRGSQEQTRAQLPTHDIRPLVDQHGKVPVRLNPPRISGPDDRFAGWTDHQRLLKPTGRYETTVRPRL